MDKQEEKKVQKCSYKAFTDEPVRPVMSKLAILSLLLGILSLFLFILAGIPAILIGIISILRILRRDSKLKGKYIALAGMNISILFMFVFCQFWRIDAPPIPNDYTIADLRCTPAQCSESFYILKKLIDDDPELLGAPGLGLTEEDIELLHEITHVFRERTPAEISESLRQYDEAVQQAWDHAQKAREEISQLNDFFEIADLTEPDPFLKQMHTINLLHLVHLYQVHAFLLTKQEDIHTFTTHLVEFDSVIRKFTLNVRPYITKLVCNVCISKNIITANAIANNPGASR